MSSASKNKSWKDSIKNRKYDEHKHCIVCGRAIPITQDFCGQDCREKYGKVEKDKDKKGKWQIVMIFIVMIVMMFILPSLGG